MNEPNTATTMLPTSPKSSENSKEPTVKAALPALSELGKLPADLMEYCSDAAQRSVLFLDILRRSGNQYEEMRAHTINSVLIYDYEFVLRGDALPRPVNYALVRVVPPAGVELDERKRPVVVIDPRAGQGPGIGGFKPVSEIGDAFKSGHPVYFIGFAAEPLDGQRVEDVARAFTVFIEKVRDLHPKSPGGPFVVGNCQAGWHAMMAACMRPDLVGPILIAGAPLSYWAGVRGKNPMRYLGGMLGGSWLSRLTSDLGNGLFDGAWLVANFDSGNPSNTLWGKQYNVWANPEQQENRYLQFEKWWSDFVMLRGEELQYMVDNLFIGNKLSTAQIVTSDGIRLDLRDIKSPIVCFCSHGDNITPPQQALDWILDCYESVEEIRRSGQTILYCLNQKVGHLAIFVGTEVAAKEHAEFMNYMELIDSMPPGLYEIVIAQKSGPAAGAGDVSSYDVSIAERGLEDIRSLGCNSLEDEREFAAVARVSELTNAFYQNYLQPWVKAMATPQLALAIRELQPLRLRYSSFSDQNPLMRALAPLAEQARTERTVPASDNPFVAMQEHFSRTMTEALNLYGETRDWLQEQVFHGIYGSPLVQAWCGISQNDGPPRKRPGQSPATRAALEAETRRLRGRLAEGSALDAAARIVVYISMTHQRVEGRHFDAVQMLLAAHPEVSLARFKEALRDQWAILALDERAAIESLPQLLPEDTEERRALMEMIKSVFATDRVDADVQRRLREIEQLLLVETKSGRQSAGAQTRTKRLERAEKS
jgi:pimeloyl-ACP methyl ester carboxylesterase